MDKIVFDDSDEVLGMIGIWRIDWKEPQAYEMGWFILPEHQEKIVAAEAARIILSQARDDRAVCCVHAFPFIHNAASRMAGLLRRTTP